MRFAVVFERCFRAPDQADRPLADCKGLGLPGGKRVVRVRQAAGRGGVGARVLLGAGDGDIAGIAADKIRRFSRRQVVLAVVGVHGAFPSQVHGLLIDGEGLCRIRRQGVVRI